MADYSNLQSRCQRGEASLAGANNLLAECYGALGKLMAENERLHAMTTTTMGVGSGEGSLFVHGDYDSIKAAQAIVIDRDELRAEVAGLRTGYQAYERVNAELKAEVEKLRKAIADIDGALEREYWSEYAGLEETRAILDAAMSKGEQS